MKRILSFMLALVLVFTLFPTQAQAAKGDKLVALTFDDGPNATLTPKLLDGLKERGVKATFFMLGNRAKGSQSIVQRAYDEGHEIANHSWSHPEFCGLSMSSVKSQIADTNAVLDQACGKGTDYIVRLPYGSSNETVRAAIGAPLILWSVDTLDWKYLNSSHVSSYIIQEAYDGAIILCHDIHSTTIPGVLQAIDVLLQRGYEFVTVSELYRRRGVEMTDGTRYYDCRANGTDLGPVEKPVVTYEAVEGGVKITMESPSGAPIYYSADGSRLTQQSQVYTGSFVVALPVNLRAAAAFKLNGGRSEEVVLKMDKLPCAPVTFAMTEGVMQLSCATKDVPIYYTLDTSRVTEKSSRYTGPVAVEPGCVIRAAAGGGEYQLSPEVLLYYSPNRNLFADVMPYHWHAEYIDILAAKGLMTGMGDYRFAPDTATSRAMVVTLLYRYCGEALESGWTRTNSFTDVAEGQWYSEAVEWACANGIIKGYPDNTFRPDQSISRQEMAQMMVNFLNFRGNSLPAAADCRTKFKDGNQIGGWALDSVSRVVGAGLMQGDAAGNLTPNSGATRAEFSAVLVRLMEYEAELEEERQEQEQPEEPEPAEPEETQPTQPEETEPEETRPSEPEETEPEETQPTEPEETEPEETQPTEPEETEPEETQPSEPEETEPEETQPSEPEETEPEPTESTPPETSEPTEPAETEA